MSLTPSMNVIVLFSLDFPWTPKAEVALHETFKMNKFRPMQRAAINITMASKQPGLVPRGFTSAPSEIMTYLQNKTQYYNKKDLTVTTFKALNFGQILVDLSV